jgi:pimeloyl-ACP methyl ester carboxylesterase
VIPEIRSNRRGGLTTAFYFVCLSLLLAATGCSPSRIMGSRIIAAPNNHAAPSRREAIAAIWEKFEPSGATNPCVYVTVPVGPPEAEISALALPPRNYPLKITSKLEQSGEGKRRLSLMLVENADDTFVPLEQPATVILLHGYMLYKETMAPWALLLAQAGYRVVLVDLRGHGESTGHEISFGKHETHDLVQVLDYLQKDGLCEGKVGVIGFSYGATMALHWAARDPRVSTVVAIAPYNRPDEAIVRCAKALNIPFTQHIARKALARASHKLDLKWADWSGEVAVGQIESPVLFVGGTKDTICPPDDIAVLKQAAPLGSTSIVIPEANHQVLGMWLHELGVPVKQWFDNHLQGGLRAPGGIESKTTSQSVQNRVRFSSPVPPGTAGDCE